MTVPQCGMGRGLTTDERAGTDTLSEAWLAQRLFTGTSHRDGPHWQTERQPPETFADVEAQLQVELEV
jgi:hypothetical protein